MARALRRDESAKPSAKPVSELGRRLRELSDKIAASGEKPLTRKQLEREVAERRGGAS